MAKRYFQVQIVSNVVKRDVNGNAMEEGLGYPSAWDATKINVRAYKQNADGSTAFCLCEIDNRNNTLITDLLKDAKVTELNSVDGEALITATRPKPNDVKIILSGDGLAEKTNIETFLNGKGLSYSIE